MSVEKPVKLLPMFVDGLVVARQPVGDDAFVALIANDMGTRVVAAVKDGPKDLAEARRKIALERPEELFDWFVLSENNIPLLGKGKREVTLYGSGGPMNLTGVQIVSFDNDADVEAARDAVERMTKRAVMFVKTLQSAA